MILNRIYRRNSGLLVPAWYFIRARIEIYDEAPVLSQRELDFSAIDIKILMFHVLTMMRRIGLNCCINNIEESYYTEVHSLVYISTLYSVELSAIS